MLFRTHLVNEGYQSSTIKSYFSAIKHILKVDGYLWRDDKVLLATITKSCRLLNDKVKIKLPIKMGLPDAIMFELERSFGGSQPQPYLKIMYKAAFALAYYRLMRIGELASGSHPVLAKDVQIAHNKDKILLVLHTSKTHGKESLPQKIKIPALDEARLSMKFFCPFKLVCHYMSYRGNYLHQSEPCLVYSDHSPVTPTQFRNTLQQQIKKLDLDPMQYNTHSFRIGRTCDMFF